MPTGYEGYTLSELERIAYESQNFLAQEVIERCNRTPVETLLKQERVIKSETPWVRKEPT